MIKTAQKTDLVILYDDWSFQYIYLCVCVCVYDVYHIVIYIYIFYQADILRNIYHI